MRTSSLFFQRGWRINKGRRWQVDFIKHDTSLGVMLLSSSSSSLSLSPSSSSSSRTLELDTKCQERSPSTGRAQSKINVGIICRWRSNSVSNLFPNRCCFFSFLLYDLLMHEEASRNFYCQKQINKRTAHSAAMGSEVCLLLKSKNVNSVPKLERE